MYDSLLEKYLSAYPLTDRTTAFTHFEMLYSRLFSWESYNRNLQCNLQYTETRPHKKAAPVVSPIHSHNAVDHPFITVNKYRISVMAIDCDNAPVKNGYSKGLDPETYTSIGLPLPNAVVQTRRGYQAYWFLKKPIHKQHRKACDYYRELRLRIIAKLGADQACNVCGSMRNPFYIGQEHKAAFFHNAGTELCDFDIFERAPRYSKYNPVTYEVGQRNKATFKYALNLFKESAHTLSLSDLFSKVDLWVKSRNCDSLPRSEIQGICSSVFRNGQNYRIRADRNYGAMNLPEIDYSHINVYQRLAIIRHRQALGGKYAAQLNKQRTFAKLKKYMERLVAIQENIPSKSKLAKVSACSRSTVIKHWRALNELVSLPCTKRLTGNTQAAPAKNCIVPNKTAENVEQEKSVIKSTTYDFYILRLAKKSINARKLKLNKKYNSIPIYE